MRVKKPDDIILSTPDGEACGVVRHTPTQLEKPVRIRYIVDISRLENGDFDIDFSYRNELKMHYPHEINESVHLLESKVLLKMSLSDKQLNSDEFFKSLFRGFMSAHFGVSPKDLLIRVIYQEAGLPETVLVTFFVEQDTLTEKLATIDAAMCSHLIRNCLVTGF